MFTEISVLVAYTSGNRYITEIREKLYLYLKKYGNEIYLIFILSCEYV